MAYMLKEDELFADYLFRPSVDDVSQLQGKYRYVIVCGSNSIESTAEQIQAFINSKHFVTGGAIILSGKWALSNPQPLTEARRLLNRCLELGMDEKLFLLEEESTNALQNFEYAAKYVPNGEKILVIAKAFIAKRSQLYCQKFGLCADFLGVTEKAGGKILRIARNEFSQDPGAACRVVEEILRLWQYSNLSGQAKPAFVISEQELFDDGIPVAEHIRRIAAYRKIENVFIPKRSSFTTRSLYLPREASRELLLSLCQPNELYDVNANALVEIRNIPEADS